MKDSNSTDILLITDRPRDAKAIEILLKDSAYDNYCSNLASTMVDALEILNSKTFQVAFLDISLKDGAALENIINLKKYAPDLSIVVLSEDYDELIALEAIKSGAQDYLVKGKIDEWQLTRALNYAVERKRIQQGVHFMAHHDQLTGLTNRTLFRTRLEHALHGAERRDESVAVLYLDLDHFKSINDNLGHDAGDKILIEIAHRLSRSVRRADTVARLGGDEFAIMLEGIQDHQGATLVADKILTNLIQPIAINQQTLTIGTSMGITFYPESGEDADTLVKNADSAMYHAKHNGRNQYQLYTEH